MKALSAPVLAALAGGSVAIATLISLDFAGTPIYLNTSTWDLTWQRRVNLFLNSSDERSTSNEYVAAYDMAGIIDTYGIGTYTVSFDLKSDVAGSMYVYCEDRSSRKYHFDAFSVASTATYQRFSQTITVQVDPTGGTAFSLSFYGGYGSGAIPHVKNIQLEPGEFASAYTPTTSVALNDPGAVYKGAYGLGQISAIADKPGEAAGITLELHGADAARISLALDDADIVQGTPCTIRTAIIDTTTYTILDAPIEWVGKLDTMAIAEDGASATIAVTAESGAVDLLRGNAWTFTDADQRIVNAADASFSYVLDQIDKPIIWPTKAFFYK